MIGQQISQTTINGTFQTAAIQIREGYKAGVWLQRYVGKFYTGGLFVPADYVAATPGALTPDAVLADDFAKRLSLAADWYYGRAQKLTNDNSGDYIERNLVPLI